MTFSGKEELCRAAERLTRLAELVEQTGLDAADIGKLLLDTFSNSPIEHPADVRCAVVEMSRSTTHSTVFVAGLRSQAEQLRRRAASAS